ncbi:MAG: hypothetical protein KIT22_00335 [Verrucomicrobiae bacterium]|nr:hypothetical protein [Verrucomicrobiae bacterium]
MNTIRPWLLAFLVALLHPAGSSRAAACAACFGKSDSPLAHGMNAGILLLLAVIGTMLGLIASFFVFMSRRSSRLEAAGSEEPTV